MSGRPSRSRSTRRPPPTTSTSCVSATRRDGARLIASNIKPTASLPQSQPACLTNSRRADRLRNWGVSASWRAEHRGLGDVHSAARAQRHGGESQIPFVVRNDASKSEILLQTSDATWEAYNAYAATACMCAPSTAAGERKATGPYAVSYNRPFDGSFVDDNALLPVVARIPDDVLAGKNGYNVSYTTQSEVNSTARSEEPQDLHVQRHDEYWSEGQRTSVNRRSRQASTSPSSAATRASGRPLGPSTEGSNTPTGRSSPTRRPTQAPVDPSDRDMDGSWRDPRFSPLPTR